MHLVWLHSLIYCHTRYGTMYNRLCAHRMTVVRDLTIVHTWCACQNKMQIKIIIIWVFGVHPYSCISMYMICCSTQEHLQCQNFSQYCSQNIPFCEILSNKTDQQISSSKIGDHDPIYITDLSLFMPFIKINWCAGYIICILVGSSSWSFIHVTHVTHRKNENDLTTKWVKGPEDHIPWC